MARTSAPMSPRRTKVKPGFAKGLLRGQGMTQPLVVVIAMVFLFGPGAGVAEPCESSSLERIIQDSFGHGVYVEPSRSELFRIEKLFVRLLDGRRDDQTRAVAEAMELEWMEPGCGMLVLRERNGARRGRGVYAFREGGATTALQAPHSRSDRSTGRIAARLMQNGAYAAAAWNSLPRRAKDGAPGSGADLAHLDATWLVAFSRAFARVHPEGRIVQLHGYSAAKRRTRQARALDAIVSAGHVRPNLAATDIAHCLQDRGVAATGLYPIDVRELGGTTNRVGHALRVAGFFGFVHLEMSRSLRGDLLEQPDRHGAFSDCLLFVEAAR